MTAHRPMLCLLVLHVLVLAADVIAPYPPGEQARALALAPPTRVRFTDPERRWHWRPFIYGWQAVDASDGTPRYRLDVSARYPVRLFVRDRDGRFRFFGVDAPMRLMWFGADRLGRDLFSRFLYGARVSLFAGLIATMLATGVGLVLGVAAGGAGRRLDTAITFLADVALTLPWIYLLLAFRAALPLNLPPETSFWMTTVLIGLTAWPRSALLVRAGARSRFGEEFSVAARACGATFWRLSTRHVLPHVWPVAAAHAGLLLPHFVLAEMTLSFFGLGAPDSAPSVGTLLMSLASSEAVESWWLTLPALALLPVFLLYYLVVRGTSTGGPATA